MATVDDIKKTATFPTGMKIPSVEEINQQLSLLDERKRTIKELTDQLEKTATTSRGTIECNSNTIVVLIDVCDFLLQEISGQITVMENTLRNMLTHVSSGQYRI